MFLTYFSVFVLRANSDFTVVAHKVEMVRKSTSSISRIIALHAWTLDTSYYVWLFMVQLFRVDQLQNTICGMRCKCVCVCIIVFVCR